MCEEVLSATREAEERSDAAIYLSRDRGRTIKSKACVPKGSVPFVWHQSTIDLFADAPIRAID